MDMARSKEVGEQARARGRPDNCVLLNTGSGKKRKSSDEDLRAIFARFPGRFEIREVEEGSGLAEAAKGAVGDGFATVVAAGGDGTVATVAGQVADTGSRLGVVPLGTFNYFARGVGLPLDPAEAVAVIADGSERRLDIGDVNGRVFLNNASIGAYARILAEREQIYRRFGRSQIAAYWSVLKTVMNLRAPLTLKVTADGEVRRVRTPLAFVAKSAFQLEEFGLEGADCIRDGRFALLLAPDCGRFGLVRYAFRLAFRAAEQGRDFELICGRDILVETHRSHRRVAWDGERSRMEGPFHFTMRRKALRLAVPADAADMNGEKPEEDAP